MNDFMKSMLDKLHRDQDEQYKLLLEEIERKERYEIKAATIGQVLKYLKISKEKGEDFPNELDLVAWTFTLRNTNTSRIILTKPGVDPNKFDADELDQMWSKFESKH